MSSMKAKTNGLKDSQPAVNLIDIGDIFPLGRFDRIVSRFDAAINLAWEEQAVSIVVNDICAGALRIRLDLQDLGWIERVEHKPGKVLINGEIEIPYGQEKIYHSKIGKFTSPVANELVYHLCGLLLENSREHDLSFLLRKRRSPEGISAMIQAFQDRLFRAYDLLSKGDIAKSVALFKGCGQGLTPAGDDFICGLLMGMYLLDEKNALSKIREMIYSLSIGANALVNSMHYQAYHGYLDADWKALSLALQGGTDALELAVEAVIGSGETSGADKLTGFITALMNDWKRM